MEPSKRQLFLDIVINGFLPWAGYVFLQSQYGWSDYKALLAVTVIPGFFALWGIVRKGRPDLIASLSLAMILLSLALAAASDDTRVLQIRESYITGLMGLIFIASSLIKKPVLWLLAKHQVKAPSQKAIIENPKTRFLLGRVNLVWGWSFIVEFLAKLWMIDNLEISQVLALSPFMFYGVTAVTALWTFWWLRKQVAALKPGELASPKALDDTDLDTILPDPEDEIETQISETDQASG